jgi:hypothetical protein
MESSVLTEGKIYFMVWYCDHEKLLPYIDSLAFIGKNLEEEVVRDTWYFQDTGSFFELGAFPNNKPGDGRISRLYRLHEEDLFQVVDAEGLSEEVLKFQARTALSS